MTKEEIKEILFKEYVELRKDAEWYREQKDTEKQESCWDKSWLVIDLCEKLTGENMADEWFYKWCIILKEGF